MAWTVEFKASVSKDLRKLPPNERERILNFLQTILEPRASGKPLKGDMRNLWRYRVGRYRVICDLQNRRTAILVLKVSHRKEAYR